MVALVSWEEKRGETEEPGGGLGWINGAGRACRNEW